MPLSDIRRTRKELAGNEMASLRDMGDGALTLAFCRSDETVFNEYAPIMRFHRGSSPVNTIARGAPRCAFIYERTAA